MMIPRTSSDTLQEMCSFVLPSDSEHHTNLYIANSVNLLLLKNILLNTHEHSCSFYTTELNKYILSKKEAIVFNFSHLKLNFHCSIQVRFIKARIVQHLNYKVF